jgi:hypothetical protein
MGTGIWEPASSTGRPGSGLFPHYRSLAAPPPLTAAVMREPVPGRRRPPVYRLGARFGVIRWFSRHIVGRADCMFKRNCLRSNELLSVASGVTANAA